MNTFLYFAHYVLLLGFGLVTCLAFAGLRFEDRASRGLALLTLLVCGVLQLIAWMVLGEEATWRVYPFICHLPIVLSLCFLYRKPLVTALAAMTSSYLCCQIPRWFGILIQTLGGSSEEAMLTQILVLTAVGCFLLRFIAPSMAELYSKDVRSVLIFSIVPMVYYLYDYIINIYSALAIQDSVVAQEFLPLLLCLVHLAFIQIYYQEYEQKSEMALKEEMLRFTLEHQAKEVESIKRSEHEVHLLRHDLRHLLSSLSVHLEENNLESAKALIADYTTKVDSTVIKRFCRNDTLNYALVDFASRCKQQSIRFEPTIALSEDLPDMITVTSIISNALDNALNAQSELLPEQRYIQLVIKTSGKKTLISVKNPTPYAAFFIDGLPVSPRQGHGYGTQSIRYMTERLGGNCQFSCEQGQFILRVII